MTRSYDVSTVYWTNILFLAIATTVMGLPRLVHAATPADLGFHAQTSARYTATQSTPAAFSDFVDDTSSRSVRTDQMLRHKLIYLQ